MTPELEGKNGLEIAALWFAGKVEKAIDMASLEPWLTAEGALEISKQSQDMGEVTAYLKEVVAAGRML